MADTYQLLQERGIVPLDPDGRNYEKYFDWDKNAFVVNKQVYPELGLNDIFQFRAFSRYLDYKFNVQDLEDAINAMLQERITLECPDDIYSNKLFPYIQKILAKRNLVLCNYCNGSDGYIFIIYNFDEYKYILEIANKWDISIKAVDDII